MNGLKVHYLGEQVGTLAEARGGIAFEYDPTFVRSGHDLSPLQLPIRSGVHQRDDIPSMRLPGLFEDSLPDAWGRRIMTEWFRQHGTPEHALTPLAMLAYVGTHGMGALTYEPAHEPNESGGAISLSQLHAVVERVEQAGPVNLDVLAAIGSSAGGAQPKALIALSGEDGSPILGGAGLIPAAYEAWMVKFDVSRDGTAGPMEEAYAHMARAAGIDVPETRLLETQKEGIRRQHFAVKRFDRKNGKRIHHHTLAGMTHLGGGDLSYEMLLRVTHRITHDEREVWRAYRRAVFNVLASNRDDHGKNHGFLYEDRQWRLGPAYDLTFTSPQTLPERGMSIAGERKSAGRATLLKLAETQALDRRRANAIIDETHAAIARWPEFAARAGVPAPKAGEVERVLIRSLGPQLDLNTKDALV